MKTLRATGELMADFKVNDPDLQAPAETLLRQTYAAYLQWQPDGDWSTFLSWLEEWPHEGIEAVESGRTPQ